MGDKNPLFSLGDTFDLTSTEKPKPFTQREDKMLAIIDAQQAVIDQVTAASYYFAVVLLASTRTVIKQEDDKQGKKGTVITVIKVSTVLVSTQNGTLAEVSSNKLGVKPGDIVKVVMTKGDQVGIVELYDGEELPTNTGVVKKVEGLIAFIDGGDPQRPSSNSVYCGNVTVKAGDTVKILFGRVITAVVPESKEMSYSFSESTGVSWDDIAGLEEAKRDVIEALEFPIKYREYYVAYGKKRCKGLLFYGPPGNGKTMLGKAAATSIAKLYEGQPGFIYIKGPELLNSYVGATEGKIRKLFSEARGFKDRTGNPAIIFIDEADAILPRRGSGKSSDVEKTIVPQFLAEMDGLDDSGAIIILATNRPESIDEAVLREGRVDKKVRIGRPDKVVAKAILRINLKNTKLSEDLDVICDKAVEKMFAPENKMYEVKFTNGKSAGSADYCYFNLLSGATVASLAQDAIFTAMMRDITAAENAAKESKEKPAATGVGSLDLEKAILESYARYKVLDYTTQILQEYVEKGVQVIDLIKADGIIKPAVAASKN